MTTKSRETAHTPGPWTAHDDGCVTTADDAAVLICKVDKENADDPEIVAADARLIAQAPALLEALRAGERGLLAALDALENERLSAQYVTPKKRQSDDSKSMSMELDHVAMESEKEARAALEEVRAAIRAATGPGGGA